MKRINVKLGDLKPNPWKQQIGSIDANKVQDIVKSAKSSSLWEQWVVRKNVKGDYEMAFGHHRLAAAIQIYGKAHEVSVQLEDYSDYQMKHALIRENMGNETPLKEQMNSLVVLRDHLKTHPEDCTYPVAGRPDKKRDREHVHGSKLCVAHALGFSESKVQDILGLEGADETLLDAAAPPTGSREGSHVTKQGEVQQKSVVALAKLPVAAQKVAAKFITKSEEPLPVAAVKNAVSAVLDLPEEERAEAIVPALEKFSRAHHKEKAKKKSISLGRKSDKKTLDWNGAALKLAMEINEHWVEGDHFVEAVESLAKFQGGQENTSGMKSLVNSLSRLQQRITKTQDLLVSRKVKQLKA
jgi:ParB-like chromosome segregation protein Spo0J